MDANFSQVDMTGGDLLWHTWWKGFILFCKRFKVRPGIVGWPRPPAKATSLFDLPAGGQMKRLFSAFVAIVAVDSNQHAFDFRAQCICALLNVMTASCVKKLRLTACDELVLGV